MEKLVLDTSVLVEYIIFRSPLRPKVAKLFDKTSKRKVQLVISSVTLAETLYVASRIYQIAGIKNPNKEAINLIEWLKTRTQVSNINENIAVKAGELKKQLGLALPDCIVIATANTLKATPLFKKLEKEMENIEKDLRSMGIKFLEEIE